MIAPLSIRICHLYPTLLSVAGDRGNLFAIQRRWSEAAVGATPDFTRCDMILFHGGQDKEMDVAARDLAEKAASLRAAAESDVVILAVCAGFQLLGHFYQPFTGQRLEGAGVLDLTTQGGADRFMNHIAIECDFAAGGTQTLVGFENHSGRTYLGPGAQPLGRVIAGSGNNGGDGGEGARSRQVYGTYLHGPVLPKNPWFTDHLIAAALRHRYGEVEPLTPLPDGAEDRAHEAALKMAMRLKGKMTAMEPTVWRREA